MRWPRRCAGSRRCGGVLSQLASADPVEVGVGDGEITRASAIEGPQFGVAKGVGTEAEYSAATQTAV